MYESPRIASVQTITSAYGSGALRHSAGGSGCAFVNVVLAVNAGSHVNFAVNYNVGVNVNGGVNVNADVNVNMAVAWNASQAAPRKQRLQACG